MIKRQTLLRTSLASGLLLLATMGCSQMQTSQSLVVYRATLNGAQEVPPAATQGSGSAQVVFDSRTSTLSWTINHSGMTGPATAAHFHGPANPGQNAGVLVPIANINAQPVKGQVVITAQQAGDLAAGRWYINIHSARYPGGEIRGQVVR